MLEHFSLFCFHLLMKVNLRINCVDPDSGNDAKAKSLNFSIRYSTFIVGFLFLNQKSQISNLQSQIPASRQAGQIGLPPYGR